MPRNSNAFDRYQRINELFNLRKGNQAVVTTSELMQILDISRRQLRTDIQKMKEIGAPLQYIASERGWRYEHPFDFSDSIPFSGEDIMKLHLAVATLNQINQIPEFKGLEEILDKIRRSVSRWVDQKASAKSLFFDTIQSYEGSIHLPFFLHAIESNRQVVFEYQSFNASEPRQLVFDPYFLKQHDYRWYVGGFSHDSSENFIRTFPLERITGKPGFSGRFFNKPKDFDPKDYWRQIIGIFRPPNGVPEIITLEFSYLLGRYFLSTPFYEPFSILEESSEQLIIQMEIIINIELIRKIASYGKDVRVITPVHFAEMIRDFHMEAISSFSSVAKASPDTP